MRLDDTNRPEKKAPKGASLVSRPVMTPLSSHQFCLIWNGCNPALCSIGALVSTVEDLLLPLIRLIIDQDADNETEPLFYAVQLPSNNKAIEQKKPSLDLQIQFRYLITDGALTFYNQFNKPTSQLLQTIFRRLESFL